MTWAFDQPIAGNEKVVLLALADWARDDGLCWPGQEAIARKARVSDRTVRDILSRLEGRGMITREKRGDPAGGRKPDLIRLTLPEGSSGSLTGSPTGGFPEAHAGAAMEPSGNRQDSLDAGAPARKPVTYRSKRVPLIIVGEAERLLGIFNEAVGR